MITNVLNTNDLGGIVEDAYAVLATNAINSGSVSIWSTPDGDIPANDEITDDMLLDAVADEADDIAGPFPEITLLVAFARDGYLDNDPIWEEINDAIARGLQAYADGIWEEYGPTADEDEDWEE